MEADIDFSARRSIVHFDAAQSAESLGQRARQHGNSRARLTHTRDEVFGMVGGVGDQQGTLTKRLARAFAAGWPAKRAATVS